MVLTYRKAVQKLFTKKDIARSVARQKNIWLNKFWSRNELKRNS